MQHTGNWMKKRNAAFRFPLHPTSGMNHICNWMKKPNACLPQINVNNELILHFVGYNNNYVVLHVFKQIILKVTIYTKKLRQNFE